MNAMDLLAKARESGMKLDTVFGEPVTVEGLVIIPVARIKGGAGGSFGPEPSGASDAKPRRRGGGFGIRANPLGVFVVKDGKVDWRPALDLNKVILGGQIVGAVALLTIGSVVRILLNRRR
jgi:uncharacterized spore protein YtfJ